MLYHLVIEPGKGLPTHEMLLTAMQTHKAVTFNYTTLPAEYLSTLTYALPSHRVSHREWDKTILIYPSIPNEKILTKKYEFFECANAFRRDGTQLMQLVSSTFGVDLHTLDGLSELKFKKSHKQRGKLNKDWDYYFHGSECRFENNKTGQVVEIIIITRPEFGYLDTYFFYNYMATTEKFKSLAAYFDNDYHQIGKAIDLLVFEGILTRVPGIFTYRNVIAL